MFDFLKQGEVTLKEVEKTIKELPLPEKVKAIAIYKRYKQIKKIEEDMQAAIREVEKKYLKLDEPVLNNVSDIVSGKRSIKEEELKDLPKYLNEEEIKTANEHLEARRIDGYWSKCFSGSGMIKEQLGKDDESLLKCIDNIHVVDEEGTDNFTIIFSFKENEIIKNKELTKKFYLVNSAPIKSEASPIDWVARNLTLKEVKKKQKNKKTGQQRVVTKTVKAKSFFNFFTSIDLSNANPNPLEASEEEMKLREELEQDFEVGGVLVDEVLPYSLEYYLGVEHDGDEGFGDEEGEDDESGSDEEAGKKKHNKKESKSKSKSKSKGKEGKKEVKAEEKPECKQQ
jgi:nucleosome assembly protein 1-like 1